MEDEKTLQQKAIKYFETNKYIPHPINALNEITPSLTIWLPLIYWLLVYRSRLTGKRHQLHDSSDPYINVHRKFIYDNLRTAVQYCPLEIFKSIIKYTGFKSNDLQGLITPKMPMDKFCFLVLEYGIKLKPRVLLRKLSLGQILQIYDIMFPHYNLEFLLLNLDYLADKSNLKDKTYNHFKTLISTQSIRYRYLQLYANKNIISIIWLYF